MSNANQIIYHNECLWVIPLPFKDSGIESDWKSRCGFLLAKYLKQNDLKN